MNKIFYIFRFSFLIVALLSLSCATTLQPAKKLSKLDDKDSIIFGKVELWKNDKPMDKPFKTFLDTVPMIRIFVSKYVSDASLNRNRFVAGEYAFQIKIFKDGYFAFTIPPGSYYFVEFDYCDIFNAAPLLLDRTYTGRSHPFLMTFDVSTNQAVYIGTIRKNFHVKWDNWFFFKSNLFTDCTNEFDQSKKWFLQSNQRFETNIVEGIVKTRNLPK
jgi:hypothetical protein